MIENFSIFFLQSILVGRGCKDKCEQYTKKEKKKNKRTNSCSKAITYSLLESKSTHIYRLYKVNVSEQNCQLVSYMNSVAQLGNGLFVSMLHITLLLLCSISCSMIWLNAWLVSMVTFNRSCYIIFTHQITKLFTFNYIPFAIVVGSKLGQPIYFSHKCFGFSFLALCSFFLLLFSKPFTFQSNIYVICAAKIET